MSVNKVIIIGNVGADPETRYSARGDAMCNITVATTDSWKDKATGEKKELTEWHRVSFFGKLAEIAGQYLKKGKQVYIEGSLRTRKWEDKQGVERYTTEIRADVMQMLGGKSDDTSERSAAQAPSSSPKTANNTNGGGFSDFPDDIPFACPRGAVLNVI